VWCTVCTVQRGAAGGGSEGHQVQFLLFSSRPSFTALQPDLSTPSPAALFINERSYMPSISTPTTCLLHVSFQSYYLSRGRHSVFISRSFFFILVNINFFNVFGRLLHCFRRKQHLNTEKFATLVKTLSHLASPTRQNRNVYACAINFDTVNSHIRKIDKGVGEGMQ
jgi:hypothetical protein